MTSLTFFHEDVLAGIVEHIDGFCLAKLWFCGSVVLNTKLGKLGGCKKFCINFGQARAIYSWPRILSYMHHLQDVYVDLPFHRLYPAGEQYPPVWLPPTVKRLALNAPVQMLAPLSELFPSLEHLEMMSAFWKATSPSLRQNLPSSLISLRLEQLNLTATTALLSVLPLLQQLQTLNLIHIEGFDYDPPLPAMFGPELHSLKIITNKGLFPIINFPPALTRLALVEYDLMADKPSSATTDVFMSLLASKNNLKELALKGKTVSRLLWNALPPSLTKLQLLFTEFDLFNEGDWNPIPPELQELKMPQWGEGLGKLPTTLRQCSVPLPNTFPLSSLPTTVHTLHLGLEARQADFKKLPPSVTNLTLGQIASKNCEHLPASISTLQLGDLTDIDDADDVTAFPDSLTSLFLQELTSLNFNMLPKKLLSLNMHLTFVYVSQRYMNWSKHLPSSLTSLKITCQGLPYTNEFIQCLPRGLKVLQLRHFFVQLSSSLGSNSKLGFSTACYPLLPPQLETLSLVLSIKPSSQELFSALPASLTDVTISSLFHTEISEESFQKLPARLRIISLPTIAQSAATKALQTVVMSKTGVVLHFEDLEKLPSQQFDITTAPAANCNTQ